MTLSRIQVRDHLADVSRIGREEMDGLATAVHDALRRYPHYVVVSGFPASEERDHVVGLADAVCSFPAPDGTPVDAAALNGKISFTKVRIDSKKASLSGSATHYSRTHRPLAPHTDSSYKDEPHELVIFQMVVSDAQGGNSIIAPVEDILSRIDGETRSRLRQPVFPLGQGTHAILWGEGDDCQIRYYRNQIDRSLEDGVELAEDDLAALAKLDRVLAQSEAFDCFHLDSGDVLFMNNRKVLHGRSGFAADSDRLMFRYRLYAPSLQSCRPAAAVAPTANGAAPDAPAADAPAAEDSTLDRLRARAAREPDLAEAQFRLGEELDRQDEVEDALTHYRRAVELKPDDARYLEHYGDLLLHLGRFEEATEIFRRCLAVEPDGYDPGLALSSLLREAGKTEEAAALLTRVMRKHPCVAHSAIKAERPTILRLRGVERSAYGIWERPDGRFEYLLRGGHFSIRDLIHRRRFNLYVLNVHGGNLDGLDGELPAFDVILNTMACPDLKRGSLLAAARFVDRHGDVPLVNHPRRVLETGRDRNYHRLNVMECVGFPMTERLWWDGRSADDFIKEIEGFGFSYPLILRRAGTQTGTSIGLVRDESRLRRYLERHPAGALYYCIEYRDIRRRDGLYNKMRVFCIDGRYYPVANLLHNSWQIHSGDRYSVMADNDWTQQREKAYLGDFVGYIGEQNFNRLRRIRDLMGLDFFGIDYTILDDGSLFLFEINAAMRHNFDHVGAFPYTGPYLERISRAFHRMVEERATRGRRSG